MKTTISIALFALVLASCGEITVGESPVCDTTKVDSIAVDSVKVDTAKTISTVLPPSNDTTKHK